ncbi:MAG: ribonuclease BN, partial [Alphaproteobacteria bacterium]|nr:ribonuclease BN [Alphaproteobacteria bacterium]
MNLAQKAIEKADWVIWQQPLAEMPRLQASGILILRVLYALVRDLLDGQLSLRAMSLVYTTLLSLVPLLAISFSVLKGFGGA